MSTLPYSRIDDDVLAPIRRPGRPYLAAVAVLGLGVLWAAACWMIQVKLGMGMAGLNIPVGWGTYITNFVFWVGIAHSGTLISAILHLVRSRWRTAVSRSAEAMTIFAVMTAGLFPLIHLGRVWVFYYIIPYPSQRQIWPDPLSPLFWDICAITTYLIVSTVFWYVGAIPDLASLRDRLAGGREPTGPAAKVYGALALGWDGSGQRWRHHGRAYLFFAALATPLVVSVHSVVSWDFAVSLLPGWHSTIFAPYFVAGAIHSGLAMVLTLLIPMRKLLHLERLIQPRHFNGVALTMVATTLIVGYAYLVEPFISWLSGDQFERQFAAWRASGWIAPLFWSLIVLNVAAPLTFVSRRVRGNLAALLAVSLLVNVGMWLERYVIIVGSLTHDFMPHAWRGYSPTWVEISITVGALCFFLLWFLLFSRTVPTVAISDVKEDQLSDRPEEIAAGDQGPGKRRAGGVPAGAGGLLAVFDSPHALLKAVRGVAGSALERYEIYSPMRLKEAEPLMGRGPSPVRLWTLAGAIAGLLGGFALAIYAAWRNGLIAGGKHPLSLVPYCVIGFEGLILLGTLGNLVGLVVHARLGRPARSPIPPEYRRQFTRDRFGLFVACPTEQAGPARELLAAFEPQAIVSVPAGAPDKPANGAGP